MQNTPQARRAPPKPVVYQMVSTVTSTSSPARMCSWPLRPHSSFTSAVLQASETARVAFQVAAYDASQPLIIDPVLSWATYLGGSDNDEGLGIAVDPAGNAYVTGRPPRRPSFPGTAGRSIQSTMGGGPDAFVTKLNAAGTALLYSTYLGGSGDDQASASPWTRRATPT